MKFKNIPIKKAKEIKNCAWIYLTFENVIVIDWYKTLKEIKLNHVVEIVKIIGELGNGNKLPVFTMTIDFINISSEAKEFSASEDGEKYTLANAVLIDNLAKALIFNFYLKLNKPKIPTKGFTSINDGLIWLKAHSKESEKVKMAEMIN
jgi:hypothetical protein